MSLKKQCLIALALGSIALPTLAASETVLNVVTAGSQNMVDYVKTFLAPKFEATHPGVTIHVVGTGPGDAGSNKINEKLEAQQQAGSKQWDIDVAVVHEKAGGQMVQKGLLARYTDDVETSKLATRDSAKYALGANVQGYVIPMFHSQTAIAYNSDLIDTPPSSYDGLIKWTKEHPKAFGYNGIKNGMSGLAFVTGWVYAYGGGSDALTQGEYNKAQEKSWSQAFEKLKQFNSNVTFTPGNAGTLDMLNRGEIAMGPVWVDMFYSWKADGKLSPAMKLKLIAPGMPGQPMYYVVPEKAANKKLAEEFIALATSPEIQANGIVKQFNWYPGIDANFVQSQLDKATWAKLFKEITPTDLKNYGKSFPTAAYFDDIKEGYERQVEN